MRIFALGVTLPRVVPGLRFKLSTGDAVVKTVESEDQVSAELNAFRVRHEPYSEHFFLVDDGVLVARDAVVSVRPVNDEEPFVL